MKMNGLRWWVIALIALATIINYIDRQALSVLWPDIVEDLFPDESALERKQIYANISVVFVFAYAFGQAIFAPTKAFERKPHMPGQHGLTLRRKVSEYSIGLNEKQKLRYMYGVTEKQFRLTFEKAKNTRGVTGEIFLQILESRLDNVVYRLGFAKSRAGARQLVNHGHICVNGHKTDISSFIVKEGDEIEVPYTQSAYRKFIKPTRNSEETQKEKLTRTNMKLMEDIRTITR